MRRHLNRGNLVSVSKRLILAVAFALLLSLLGLFTGLGHRVLSLEQVSFAIHSSGAYADAVFYCDIIYNPALFPYYWLIGAGHLSGNFSMVFIPEGYMPGEYGGPVWGRKPQDRYDTYITKMLIWGIAANLAILLLITLLIEVLRKRVLYLVLFGGVIGFALASIAGAFIGLFLGAFAVAYITFKMPEENFLKKFWKSLWE